MGFLDALFGRKKTPLGDVRLVPCILCGKDINVARHSPVNKFFYSLAGKHYALCGRGCDGKGRADDHKLWSRIAAISEAQRSRSDVSDIS